MDSNLPKKALQWAAMIIVVGVAFLHWISLAVLLGVAGLGFFVEMTRLVRRHGLTIRVFVEFIIVNAGLYAAFYTRVNSFAWALAIGLCITVSDSAANLFGWMIRGRLVARQFSKHSPNKTWEGAIIGVLFGLSAFVLVVRSETTEPWWVLAVAGLAVAVAGVWGDLQQSRMKRELGVKDVSRTLGAHGGFSERLDSISRGYIVGAILMIIYGLK